MTQAGLGDIIGKSQQIIDGYEKGDQLPPRDTVERIAQALGVDVWKLVWESDSKEFVMGGPYVEVERIRQIIIRMERFLAARDMQGQIEPEERADVVMWLYRRTERGLLMDDLEYELIRHFESRA